MQRENRFFYGWVIVVVGVLVYSLAYGVRYSFSVIFPSLLEQFHWTRDATAAMLSFHLLVYGITAPIAGALVDRVGTRKTMTLGAILLVAGTATSGLSKALWHFYLTFGLLVGVGLCLTGAVPFTRIIGNWFVAKRGLALSFISFGSGGAFLLYPLIAFLIEKVGWQGAFLVEAAMVAVLILPAVAFLVRFRPEEMGLQPDGKRNSRAQVKVSQAITEAVVDKVWAATDWTLFKAMKTFRFWALCFSTFALWGVSEHILVAHHAVFAEDVGYSKLYASSVLALMGAFMSAGALVGLISDRIGREATFSIATVIGVSGIVMIMLIRDTSQPWLLYLYSILFGLGFGMTPPTIAAAAIDMFQGRRAGAIIGFVWFAFAFGGSIGPWLGGFIFEISNKSYLPAFALSAAMFVLACISLWLAAPRRVRLVAGRAKARKGSGRSSIGQA